MALDSWNWLLPADPQDYPWDCAACSTAWCTRTIGYSLTEQDMIAALGPSRISASYGLLDASGSGLVECLGELGINAANNPNASFQDVMDAAGYQPMAIGGRAWCHWVAVRVGGQAIGRPDIRALSLMNPASGYAGVYQVLYETDWARLGPFSAVWFESW